MEEERKFIRFEAPLKTEVIIKAHIDSFQQGITKDFSREGLRLILHNFGLEKGQEIGLRIYIPGKKEPSLVRGKIVWAKSDEESWELGVKIKEIDKEAKAQILDYAYKIWREKLKGQ